jgi:Glycosyltransferases involved in cell wall biogenesis
LITSAAIVTINVGATSEAERLFLQRIALSTERPIALPRFDSASNENVKVSIVIPCYNEKNTIEEIVEAVRTAPIERREIIIVDDCSQDGTRAVLEQRIFRMVDRIIYHPVNRGKGAALRSGFAAATGDIILVQDADLEYSPEDYPLVLGPLMSDKADAVFGSRFIGGRPHRVLFFWHMAGNRFLTLLSNMFTNLNLTDMETGCKAFKASLIKSIRIEEDRFGVEPEIVAKLARTGCRIYEVGISYSGRTYLEGKKINWRDGVRATYVILKYNLKRRRR